MTNEFEINIGLSLKMLNKNEVKSKGFCGGRRRK